MSINTLFDTGLKVVNIGLKSFKETLDQCKVAAVQVDWRPPVSVDEHWQEVMEHHKEIIDAANREVCNRVLNSQPVLTGMDVALAVIPGMKKNLILHAGPPVTWKNMCGPMRGGIIAALKYEGLAKDDGEAEHLAASGEIEYAPCHEHAAVGPMAGIVSASMPVFVVKNENHGNVAYCTMNEGLGKVLRYGAFSAAVIEKLHWMEKVL